MSAQEFDTDRRGVIGGALVAVAMGAVPTAIAAPAEKDQTTLRKAHPPRGSFGIVQPGLKRTAFMTAPGGLNAVDFQAQWIAAYASSFKSRGARSVIFNLIEKEHSPEKRFDAVAEFVFDSDLAYEQEYLGGHTAYTQEAEQTKPSLVIVSRQIGIRDFDPGRPRAKVKRFGVLKRKPELNPDTLALAWRNEHAPLFAANDYLRRYYVNLTDRTYAPDVAWDGYADIWWDDFASVPLHSDARVPIPESDSVEVMYMFMTPTVVI